MRFTVSDDPSSPAIAHAMPVDEDDDALTLPAAWTAPPRQPLPVVAAVVPLVGAGALWLVTGSMLSLWLALLGPLIAAATMLDARRAARRDRRRHAVEAAGARERVASAITRRHDSERRRLWGLHPDVAKAVIEGTDVWRSRPGPVMLVAGAGDVASSVRVRGGEGDADATALRRRAAVLTDAPIVIPARAGAVVVGSEPLAAAVQRALALQLCLVHPPDALRLVRVPRGEAEWAEALPHRHSTTGAGLAVVGPGERVPSEADIVIARGSPGDPLPPRCAALIAVTSPDDARLQHAGDEIAVRIEGLSREQALTIATDLAARAESTLGIAREADGPLTLAPLVAAAPPPDSGGLPAVIGIEAGEPAVVDLVSDGPHAVVAGVTGSGKSELLITWILALCATHTTDQVSFLLADFKGGTAFDGLAGVPHVAGVITDLDGAGARRAIESLRAEMRRRESVIASAGARDIVDPRVTLPRLVVVVDEFAALLGDHPELHTVFADIAARGRALGVHLILGTQRVSGVVRDNLLANCPLRVSLRVTDPSDSRALLGTDEASMLPGGSAARGRALVRRAGDVAASRVRIALSGADDVAAAVEGAAGAPAGRPWLPPLPQRIALDELVTRAVHADVTPLALADEPERQRQRIVGIAAGESALLVLGGPGSGVTNALEVVAVQARGGVVRVPADPEGMWDTVAALAERMPESGTTILVDDLDAMPIRLPSEYAHELMERLETVVRRAADAGVLVAAGAHRLSGVVARLADLFARRLVLRYTTRIDHAAAGGDPGAFDPEAGAGRGRLDGLEVQVALAPPVASEPARRASVWHPTTRLTGFVARRSPSARQALAAWEASGARVTAIDDHVADAASDTGQHVVVAGEPDDWQRHWRLLADVRGDHDLVVDTSCASELRMLAGIRTLPPYCEPGRGRAWLISSGADPVRIVLPDGDVRPIRRLDAP